MLGKLSLLSVGSSVTVLGDMEREVVAHGWMTPAQFVAAYAVSQATPGPGTLIVMPIGYAAAGWPGAAVALLAYFGPTAGLALLVARVWLRIHQAAWARRLRLALAPVVVGLIAAGAYSLGRATIHGLPAVMLGLAAMLLMLRTRIPIPVVVVAAGLAGAFVLAT